MTLKIDIDKILENGKVKDTFLEYKKIKNKFNILFYVGIISVLILAIFSTFKTDIHLITIFIIFYVLIFLVFLNFYNKYKSKEILDIKKTIKKTIINSLKKQNKNFKFNFTKKLFPLLFYDFYKKIWFLMPYDWIFFEEDSIKFSWDGFNFYWEEVETYTDKSGYDIDYYKEIVSHMYIFYVEILNHRFPIKTPVYIKLREDAILYNEIQLENVTFNKLFSVTSKNEIEARRLLTPKMMEKLIELYNNSKMKWWSFTFFENKIYAKFNLNGKFLEISSVNKEWIKNFLTEINLILDLVNYINLEYFSEDMFIKNNLEK